MVQHSKSIRSFVISQLAINGKGLEVAPYFDPFLDKANYDVMYTDYIGSEEIRAKAAQNPDVRGATIPDIDFVWPPGASLREIAPQGIVFDYVVSSHAVQQVPNPVGWLNQILNVMRNGGKLALFIPDRRNSSDFFRDETKFSQLVQLWIEQPATPNVSQVLDFMINSFAHNAGIVWGADGVPRNTQPAYSEQDAISTATFVWKNQCYLDVMCTVWNATTAKKHFERLVSHGIMNVAVSDVIEENGEFLIFLTKLGEPSVAPPRLTLPNASSDDLGGETARLDNIVHQLNVVRQDMTFLVDLVNQSAQESRKLIEQLGVRREKLLKWPWSRD